MKLTARQVETVKPQDKDFKLSDGGGLYLLIKTNGSKYWRLKYRIAGKEKLLAIGTFPLVTLAEARKKRDEAKKLIAEGIDPNQDKKQKKLAAKGEINNTFESIAREWYEQRKDRWSVGYRTDMMSAFENDVFPYIGHRPITEIKPLELMEVLSRMEKRGATEKLKKVRQRCGEVWKYAIITGRAEYNPAPDLASRAVMRCCQKREDVLGEWLRKLIARCGFMKATVALANKLVRIIWRILKDDVDFMMKKAVN
nr:integrase arm-type DNA-binding domain-containing protein [Xenorhabdus sp. CUL]